MSSVVYNRTKAQWMQGAIDLTSDVIRCMLLTGSSTTPDNPDHDFVSAIDADEGSDASYSRQTVSNPSIQQDDSNDRGEFHHDNIVFSSLAGAFGTVQFAVQYVQVGGDDATPADDDLVSCHDIADTTPDGSNFELSVGAQGSIHITA